MVIYGYTWQEVHARVLKGYGGRCRLCGTTDQNYLNVILVADTEAQRREYKGLNAKSICSLLFNRHFPPTHVLICTACVRNHGGFAWIGKNFKHLKQWSPMKVSQAAKNVPSFYQKLRDGEYDK